MAMEKDPIAMNTEAARAPLAGAQEGLRNKHGL